MQMLTLETILPLRQCAASNPDMHWSFQSTELNAASVPAARTVVPPWAHASPTRLEEDMEEDMDVNEVRALLLSAEFVESI